MVITVITVDHYHSTKLQKNALWECVCICFGREEPCNECWTHRLDPEITKAGTGLGPSSVGKYRGGRLCRRAPGAVLGRQPTVPSAGIEQCPTPGDTRSPDWPVRRGSTPLQEWRTERQMIHSLAQASSRVLIAISNTSVRALDSRWPQTCLGDPNVISSTVRTRARVRCVRASGTVLCVPPACEPLSCSFQDLGRIIPTDSDSFKTQCAWKASK